ncbi:MAG: nitroreductase family protein [Candidatus Omnitrophica bacterium]|nr:nitroreductase family protein [Candidatus Omnitrophota bacterium]
MPKLKNQVYKLILSRRSIRRFKQDGVPLRILKKLVNTARLAPSGANLQPLEFMVINDKKTLKGVFNALAWAGYISPNGTPKEEEQPVAYILVLVNTKISKQNYQWDVGAAMENMILAASEEGMGSCWIGSINRVALGMILNIPKRFIIDSILALGYPAESPKVERLRNDCKYWKDAKGILHVPKRDLVKVVHFNKF